MGDDAKPDTPPEHLRYVAAVVAVAVDAAQNDPELTAESREQLQPRYSTLALEFLRRAKAALGPDSWKQAALEIQTDEQYKPLRNSVEFRRLISDGPYER